MKYPRIKKFTFTYEKAYVVQGYQVGRLDKIAYEIYGATRMYKALAAANEIPLSMGYRAGVRKTEDALRLELKSDGYSGDELEIEFETIMDEKRLTDLDWNSYSDNSYGMMSDVFEGRPLLVPTFESADQWLKLYEYLEE
jgi:hypothetical protein